MGITGKYDFPGIKKAGVAAIELALASTSWGASLLANGFMKFFAPAEDFLLGLAINWMANKGLIVLNLGADWANGNIDQAAFDKSVEDGLKRVQQGRDKITPEQGKAIDDAVIKAADTFIDFGAAPDPGSVRGNVDTGLQGRGDSSV